MVEEILPDYDGASVHKVPGTVAELLGKNVNRPSLEVDQEYKHVLVLLIDGFGYKHWQDNKNIFSFLENLMENGEERILHSVYPSETAAAITSVNTGLTPSEHGLVGWNMFFKNHSASIKTLPFRTQDGEDPQEIYGESFDQTVLFDGDPIYKLLNEEDVDSHVFVPEQLAEADKENSNSMFEGSEKIGYDGLSDLSVTLAEKLEEVEGRNYLYCYIPSLDKLSHVEGTKSDRYQAELSQINNALELMVKKLDEEAIRDTAVVLTADHGFTDIDPEANIDLLEYEEVRENLKQIDGEPLMPVGSPRNTHLFLKEGKTEEVKEFLEEELDARIWTREQAIEDDLFGKSYREDFGERIGDLIVCGKAKAIWHGREPEEIEVIGYHGGLSKQEMEVPFVKADLEELIRYYEG